MSAGLPWWLLEEGMTGSGDGFGDDVRVGGRVGVVLASVAFDIAEQHEEFIAALTGD
jgi:hypothetical protein